MSIRLLIADDHSIVREGLKQIIRLQSGIVVAGEADNGEQVLQQVGSGSFDLLLLDMTMDGLSGVDLIRRIRAVNATLPILVLSMHRVSQMAFHAMREGASGYITKGSAPETLLAAIRKVASGGRYIDPLLSEELALKTAFPEQSLPHSVLSSREFEVFRLLVAGENINSAAQRLCISHKTVSTHKTRIMEKMQINSMAELVRYAVQHNLFG